MRGESYFLDIAFGKEPKTSRSTIDLIRRSLDTPASIDDTAALSCTCYTANDVSHSLPFIL